MNGRFRLLVGFVMVLSTLSRYTYAQPTVARATEDRNHVTVMELNGNYDKLPAANRAQEEAIRKAIAQEFLRLHDDDYDFVVAFSGFPHNMGSDEEGTRRSAAVITKSRTTSRASGSADLRSECELRAARTGSRATSTWARSRASADRPDGSAIRARALDTSPTRWGTAGGARPLQGHRRLDERRAPRPRAGALELPAAAAPTR